MRKVTRNSEIGAAWCNGDVFTVRPAHSLGSLLVLLGCSAHIEPASTPDPAPTPPAQPAASSAAPDATRAKAEDQRPRPSTNPHAIASGRGGDLSARAGPCTLHLSMERARMAWRTEGPKERCAILSPDLRPAWIALAERARNGRDAMEELGLVVPFRSDPPSVAKWFAYQVESDDVRRAHKAGEVQYAAAVAAHMLSSSALGRFAELLGEMGFTVQGVSVEKIETFPAERWAKEMPETGAATLPPDRPLALPNSTWLTLRHAARESPGIPLLRSRVTLFFPVEHLVKTSTCEATGSVQRVVVVTTTVAEAAIRALFDGPAAADLEKGLLSPFEKSPNDPNARPLREYFVRAEIAGKVARLHFRGSAMAYLNAAACLQQSVKTAIEHTLRALGINEVAYVVDGKVVTEWDA